MTPRILTRTLAVGCLASSILACQGSHSSAFSSGHEIASVSDTSRLRIDPIWQVTVNTKGVQAYRPMEPYGVAATSGGMVVVATLSGRLYGLSGLNGDQKWMIELGEKPGTPPTAIGHIVFIGVSDGRVVAIDARTGEEKWSTVLDHIVHGQPTYANDTIYVQTAEEAVVALDASTGAKQWTYRHPRIAEMELLGGGRPSVIDDAVYVGFSDGSLYKIDAQGHSVWSVDLSNGRRRMVDVDSPPVDFERSVIAVSNNGGVFSVDKEHGNIEWTLLERGVQTPILMDDTLICSTTNGRILWVDPHTGKIIQELALSTTGLTAPMRLTENTFAVTDGSRGVLILDAHEPMIHAIFNATVGISGPLAIHGDKLYALINRGKVYGLRLRKI